MDVAPALFFGPTHPHVVISFQYKTCKDGSVLGVTVTRIALLTHCQALTQACGYTEGMGGQGVPLAPSLRDTDSRLWPVRCMLTSQGTVLFPLVTSKRRI